MGQIVGSVNPTRPQSSAITRGALTLVDATALGEEFAATWARGAKECTNVAPELKRAPFRNILYNAQRPERGYRLAEVGRLNALFADRVPRAFRKHILTPCASLLRSALHTDAGECPMSTWNAGEQVQGATDDAERRFLFNPNDPASLDRVIEQKRQELAAVQKSLNTYERIRRDRALGILTLVKPTFTAMHGGAA